jgi:adenylosuccinate lyase
MLENLESSGGLIFSGQLLLDLAEAGMLREHAYRLVQKHAMEAWKNGTNFREAVHGDPEIRGKLSEQQIERAFDLKRQLGNVGKIFERVFHHEDTESRRKQRSRLGIAVRNISKR